MPAIQAWRIEKETVEENHRRFLAGFSPFACRLLPPPPTAIGTASAAIRKETTRAIAMVKASGRKKAPATPVRRANGRKITIVDRLEPTSAGSSSTSPLDA